MLRFYTH